ncbi:neuraminidase-like domain-containing protein [Pseudomonas lini]
MLYGRYFTRSGGLLLCRSPAGCPPCQYFWRRAQVELSPTCVAINPAAWDEWQPVDIPAGMKVLDIRPVFWSGRLCLVWAEWRDKVAGQQEGEFLPHKLDINLAFMTQNGQWAAPLNMHSSEHNEDKTEGTRLIATVWADRHNPKGKLGVFVDRRQGWRAIAQGVRCTRCAVPPCGRR